MENRKNKLSVLLKSYWDIKDIETYYSVGESKAIKIKNNVEKIYGVIPCEDGQERAKVSADNVIIAMGGKSRLEELEIFKKYKEVVTWTQEQLTVF